jgi:hypothetical protein
MTMKDRMVLQRTFATAARVQARSDYMAKRVMTSRTKGTAARESKVEVDGLTMTPQQQTYYAAARDVLKTYGGREALDVVKERTGASPKAAAAALDLARKNGAEVKVEPKCAGCGKLVQFWSALTETGYCGEDCYNKALQRKERPVKEGEVVTLDKIALGQYFSTDTPEARQARKLGWPVVNYRAVVVSKSPASVVVVRDALVATKREFKSKDGKTVSFESAGKTRVRMAPDMMVTALKEMEDLTLLLKEPEVQSKRSSIQDQTEEVMAAAKKAKAKSNGNGAARRGRAPSNATYEVLKTKIDTKLQAQLDNPEKLSHGVVVLRFLAKAKKPLALPEIVEGVKATKQYKTEGTPDGLIAGDVRILAAKGIVKAHSAPAAA